MLLENRVPIKWVDFLRVDANNKSDLFYFSGRAVNTKTFKGDVLATLRDSGLSSGCILDVQLLHPFDHEEVRNTRMQSTAQKQAISILR